MRKKYSRPDPKLSAEIGRASADGQKQRSGFRGRILDIQKELARAERGTGIDLSYTLTDFTANEETISDMWAKAAGVPAMAKIGRLLSDMSAEATERNRRLHETTKSFYRGTSLAEAADVGRRGGGISKDGDFNYTSLTVYVGSASLYGWWNGVQAILEYDGDSVRKTGKAVPVEYSHKKDDAAQAIGRGMPLFFSTDWETRIPDETGGPVLKNVFLRPQGVFTTNDLERIKEIRGAGSNVFTFVA